MLTSAKNTSTCLKADADFTVFVTESVSSGSEVEMEYLKESDIFRRDVVFIFSCGEGRTCAVRKEGPTGKVRGYDFFSLFSQR